MSAPYKRSIANESITPEPLLNKRHSVMVEYTRIRVTNQNEAECRLPKLFTDRWLRHNLKKMS